MHHLYNLYKAVLCLAISLLFNTLMQQSFAQMPGNLDPTFNLSDSGFANGDGANAPVSSVALQPDGKIIIAGTFTGYGATATPGRVMRLNTNGTADTGFNTAAIGNGLIKTVCLLSSGKILIGGLFTAFGGITGHIMRLNADGTVDASFIQSTSAPVSATISAIAEQADGKILVGGNFLAYNSKNYLFRLNADGSADDAFNYAAAGPASLVNCIALKTDGKILIGGNFTNYNNFTNYRYLAQLNADGTPDPGFTGAPNAAVSSIAAFGGDQLMVGGAFTLMNGATYSRLVKLNADGSVDAGFANPGLGGQVNAIAVQPDGKIAVGGAFSSPAFFVTRFTASGTIDGSFTNPGTTNTVNALALQADGKIIVGGNFTLAGLLPGRIARLNTNGLTDTSFSKRTGMNNSVSSISLQPDGKIIVAGLFTASGVHIANRISRLNADGTTDATYNTGTGFNSTVNTTALQDDGKIIAGGSFSLFNGNLRYALVRLNNDGSIDNSFNIGTGCSNYVYGIAIQPADGKVIVVGEFPYYNNTLVFRIVRLNTDGSKDATFNTGGSTGGADGTIRTIALQPNGKIIIAGNFTNFNGAVANGIVRLNADGSTDASFTPGTGANGTIYKLALQPDGRILIGGSFTLYNGTPVENIARLNPDGTLETSFQTIYGAVGGLVNDIALQPDGRIIIAGAFTDYGLNGQPYLVRLFSDGWPDWGFDATPNNVVSAIALQPDGTLLAGGSFTGIGAGGKNRIARLFTQYTALPLQLLSFTGRSSATVNLLQWSTTDEQQTNHFLVEKSTDARIFAGIGSVTATGQGFYDFNDEAKEKVTAYYRLKIVDDDNRSTYSGIVKINAQPSRGFSVYPNPAVDKTTLQLQDKKLVGTTASLMDAGGRMLRSFVVKSSKEIIDMSGLAPGMYLLKIGAGAVSVIKR